MLDHQTKHIKQKQPLLLYGNSIEESASAMEMSIIAGTNLANLTVKWFNER